MGCIGFGGEAKRPVTKRKIKLIISVRELDSCTIFPTPWAALPCGTPLRGHCSGALIQPGVDSSIVIQFDAMIIAEESASGFLCFSKFCWFGQDCRTLHGCHDRRLPIQHTALYIDRLQHTHDKQPVVTITSHPLSATNPPGGVNCLAD